MPISWLTVFLSLGSGAIAAVFAAGITAYVTWRIHKSNIDEEYRRILLPEKLKTYNEFIVETYPLHELIMISNHFDQALENYNQFIRPYYFALNKASTLMPEKMCTDIHLLLDAYVTYMTAEYKKINPDHNKINSEAAIMSGQIHRMLLKDLGIEKLSYRPE